MAINAPEHQRSEPREDVEGLVAERTQAFRRFLRLVPAETCSDIASLKWEMHAAAAGGDLERVMELGRRWEQLDSGPETLGAFARLLFLLVRPGGSRDVEPSGWFDEIAAPDRRASEVWALHTFLMATLLEPEPEFETWRGIETPINPKDFGDDQLDAFHVCHSLLCRADQKHSLNPVQQAVRAWCDFAIAQAILMLRDCHGRRSRTRPFLPIRCRLVPALTPMTSGSRC